MLPRLPLRGQSTRQGWFYEGRTAAFHAILVEAETCSVFGRLDKP
jgi:hypothetical protein